MIQTKYDFTGNGMHYFVFLNGSRIFYNRSTAMMLLAMADPKGAAQRKKHKLLRRTYQFKVAWW